MKIELTNTAPGIRGIHTVTGLVYFKPGESKSVEFVDEAQAKSAHAAGFVAGGDDQTNEPTKLAKEPEKMVDREDLKKQANELGLDYPKNIPTEKLKELIDANLAE